MYSQYHLLCMYIYVLSVPSLYYVLGYIVKPDNNINKRLLSEILV